jgi:hypothetical protein
MNQIADEINQKYKKHAIGEEAITFTGNKWRINDPEFLIKFLRDNVQQKQLESMNSKLVVLLKAIKEAHYGVGEELAKVMKKDETPSEREKREREALDFIEELASTRRTLIWIIKSALNNESCK